MVLKITGVSTPTPDLWDRVWETFDTATDDHSRQWSESLTGAASLPVKSHPSKTPIYFATSWAHDMARVFRKEVPLLFSGG